MATKGELTVGKLRDYLSAFSDDTKVVLGREGEDKVHKDCWANTYYPPEHDCTVWVVIDPGKHWIERDEQETAEPN